MLATGAVAEVRRHWPVLIGCTLGIAVGAAALPFYTAGVFVRPLQAEFGWTRSQLALASFASTMTVVVAAPIAGQAIDRFGVRLPAAFSMAALAAGFVALAHASGSFAQYLLIQIAMFALAVASTPVGFTRAVNERFQAGRGLALGLTLSGTGIAAALAPPYVAGVIEQAGWRTAYWHLAIVVAVALPIVVLLLSGRGERAAQAEAAAAPVGEATGTTLPEALRDRRFWRLVATFFVLALGVSGFVLHMVPMLGDAGMSPAEAAAVQARLGIAVIVGRLAIGVLVDRFFAPQVAALSLCFTVAGIAALALFGTDAASPAAFAIGFALGAEVDLIGYLTARYFGLRAYGRLYGLLYSAFVLGTGLSPLLIARIAEGAGGYPAALWTSAGLVSAAILLLATAPRFREEAR